MKVKLFRKNDEWYVNIKDLIDFLNEVQREVSSNLFAVKTLKFVKESLEKLLEGKNANE